jgi:hypothetical protein
MRPRRQALTDRKQERSLRGARSRCEPAVRLWFYASGRPTPQSTGVPNGGAVGYPRRFAPRHPVIAIVGQFVVHPNERSHCGCIVDKAVD